MNEHEKKDIIKLYEEVKSKGTFTYLRELEGFKSGEYYKFYLSLKSNRQVLAILNYNYFQLLKLVSHHNSPENQPKVWNEINPKYRWRQQRSITVQLFNYLSSVFAAVDYSRSNMRKYISLNSKIAENFKSSKEAYFDKNPQHKFIQDLRNYTTHNSYLRVATELKSDGNEKEIRRNIYLSKEELLCSDKWSNISKGLLDKQGSKVYIIDIIESHFPLFTGFQNWAYLALLQVNFEFTMEFRNRLEAILEFAERVNMARTSLPFNRSFIRYLDWIIKESTYRCSSQFKYFSPIPQV
ncbi:MAG: hypothetical protein LPK09_08045 [Hymenobacteraceae bacterium]|nr:hypothetical protein [Hymenobacteraceae bacterium]